MRRAAFEFATLFAALLVGGKARSADPVASLDDLARLNKDQLIELYKGGARPPCRWATSPA